MSSFRTTGRKIVAIGRNYAEHAKELNNAVPTEPFFFLKPTSSYVDNGGVIEIPKGVVAHFEVELGAVIGRRAKDVRREEAMKYVAGYALGVDMTARNVQDKVKKAGLPWSTAKGFDSFTPISSFIPASSIPDPSNVNLWLKTNGNTRQNGNTKDMIFGIPQLIEHVSSIMTLEEGDLLLTGTPSGVGQTQDGDVMEAGLQLPGESRILAELKMKVKERQGGYVFKL
ncbi:hypothetical protein BDZ90DRAFT_278700 [Jaminaea rosea]|uniref:Fumarylacetoacetase-like C-terminal domain-containing protein n=1 Tax=Jaminaea rosea TaxID=1569628 RepID=A0A316UYU8_9BASI|nr:hypothetical protein BDZ90DRAFT_278700 [Jaminaea rosea]PWN28325.1 hypothetical protein BDZ90DRAFT_278700 [Jaminaea rosea]